MPRMQIALRSMTAQDASFCALIACDSEIGSRYGFEPERMADSLRSAIASGGELFVAEAEGGIVGFAWGEPKGAFASAPYLRLIAVSESSRGSGVGSALLAEFESRTRWVSRDWCLLVSDFNKKAQAFYEQHGYRRVGALPDFARAGIAEILMVKPHGPLS
jgi:ribosomal protein S18 acetylase RimI-like enzyme